MSDFDDLCKDVSDGLAGRNAGIPMGFNRLNNHVSIRKANNYLLGGYTGCLVGETIVEIGRKQITANTHPYTLEYVYKQFHTDFKQDKWDLSLPTRIKVYKPDLGQTGLHEIEDVVHSGTKVVYEVTSNTGKKILATLDHKFMVNEQGEFKKLSELKIGDKIVCKAPYESRAIGRKLVNREEICGKMPFYFTAKKKVVAGKTYQRVYFYRAMYDAKVNNLPIGEFLMKVSSNPNHRLILSDPKMVVHHMDEDPLNNHPDNLQLLTKQQHDRLHAKTSNYGYSWVQVEQIRYIECMGNKETFDIVCKDPYHNFIANGFVVHNSGKTSLLDDAFILNPLDWYIRNFNSTEIRLKIICWSMERKKNFKQMKWISRKIFLDHGVVISVPRLMGWCAKEQRLTSTEHDLFIMYKDYLDAIMEIVTIMDYPENPTGIRKYMTALFKSKGRVEEVDEYHRVYVPENPNEIILHIKDHIGLQRKEKMLSTKKEVIDKGSEDNRFFRDFYGASNVDVSQFNRDIANPMRIKNGDVEPMLEDFKDSGNTQEDADVVICLFDPMRYKVPDPSGYDLAKLRDSQGRKKYRSLKILKNSYGADDIRIGLAFQPEIGMFREMPKVVDTTDDTYDSIIDNSYFLPQR